MAVFLYSLGDDKHTGNAGEYNQVDYDVSLSEFAIYRNTVSYTHLTLPTKA